MNKYLKPCSFPPDEAIPYRVAKSEIKRASREVSQIKLEKFREEIEQFRSETMYSEEDNAAREQAIKCLEKELEDRKQRIEKGLKLPGNSSLRMKRLKLLVENPYCNYCNRLLDKGSATIDHKVPRSRKNELPVGISINDERNLALACAKCNGTKGSLTVEEFLAQKKTVVVQQGSTVQQMPVIRQMIQMGRDCWMFFGN